MIVSAFKEIIVGAGGRRKVIRLSLYPPTKDTGPLNKKEPGVETGAMRMQPRDLTKEGIFSEEGKSSFPGPCKVRCDEIHL